MWAVSCLFIHRYLRISGAPGFAYSRTSARLSFFLLLFTHLRRGRVLRSRRERQQRRAETQNLGPYLSLLPPSLSLSRHGGEDVVACLLAAAAGLGADTAVLVVGGMPLALITAQMARLRAGLKGGPRHLGLEGRLAGEYLPGGVAHVGAVEVEPDARDSR